MLVLKIISTVFVGISCVYISHSRQRSEYSGITTVLKNLIIVLYSLLWRALVIVTIWVV